MRGALGVGSSARALKPQAWKRAAGPGGEPLRLGFCLWGREPDFAGALWALAHQPQAWKRAAGPGGETLRLGFCLWEREPDFAGALWALAHRPEPLSRKLGKGRGRAAQFRLYPI